MSLDDFWNPTTPATDPLDDPAAAVAQAQRSVAARSTSTSDPNATAETPPRLHWAERRADRKTARKATRKAIPHAGGRTAKSSGPARTPRLERPTSRGWARTGGGYVTRVEAPPEFRGTTVQVCGLWPFSVGAGTPMVGVPMGKHQTTGATLCCDPISWFQPDRGANLINNPSMFVLGMPGLGKSTWVRRMAMGLCAYGVIPLALGDLKPDYVRMVRALGGQIIRLGPGRDRLNVLDPGASIRAARRLRAAGFDEQADEVLADARKRRRSMVEALLLLIQPERPKLAREMMVVDAALRMLDHHDLVIPEMGDLYRLVKEGPEPLRAAALDRGSLTRYQELTEDLEAALRSLVSGDGAMGDTFSGPTTTRMRMDVPVAYDVSATGDSNDALAAGLLLACWSTGFATVNIAQVLADVGLEPRRHYLTIVDELWRALQFGGRIVDAANSQTRLNRETGTGVVWCSHTMKDLEALALEEDRMKARGFVERAGIVVCGGLPESEMPRLNKAVTLTGAEMRELTEWSAPGEWNSALGRTEDPPGRGKFLIKVGARPGIPVYVALTDAEREINDTNQRWHELSRVGRYNPDDDSEEPEGTEPSVTVDLTSTDDEAESLLEAPSTATIILPLDPSEELPTGAVADVPVVVESTTSSPAGSSTEVGQR